MDLVLTVVQSRIRQGLQRSIEFALFQQLQKVLSGNLDPTASLQEEVAAIGNRGFVAQILFDGLRLGQQDRAQGILMGLQPLTAQIGDPAVDGLPAIDQAARSQQSGAVLAHRTALLASSTGGRVCADNRKIERASPKVYDQDMF